MCLLQTNKHYVYYSTFIMICQEMHSLQSNEHCVYYFATKTMFIAKWQMLYVLHSDKLVTRIALITFCKHSYLTNIIFPLWNNEHRICCKVTKIVSFVKWQRLYPLQINEPHVHCKMTHFITVGSTQFFVIASNTVHLNTINIIQCKFDQNISLQCNQIFCCNAAKSICCNAINRVYQNVTNTV